MLTVITIIFLIFLMILWKMFLIVTMREAVVVERLGKFHGVLSPGLHFLIPFVDRAAYRHEMREQVMDIPSQDCITRDNMQVEVDGLVYLKVMDPQRASYGIGDYRVASINLAQTTMRSEVGKLTLGEMFAEREQLNENIVREIDKASDPWGIKVLRYEIRNITPSEEVIHTLEKQMEAERAKRAEITLATAQKEARINHSMGERQEAINLSEGDKQRRINEATGRAKSIELVAVATAQGIQNIAGAIHRRGGKEAVSMQVVQKYLGQLGHILDTAEVTVMPTKVAQMATAFEGLGQAAAHTPAANSQTSTAKGGRA